MPEGRVLAWTDAKGIGVLSGDDDRQVFVHHTRVATPGFKNLVEGQRVRYEIQSEPRGDQAVDVVPLPLFEEDLSPDEWRLLKPVFAEHKISVTTKDRLDRWKRPWVRIVVDLASRERVTDEIRFIQPELKDEQPDDPVWVVDFDFDDGAVSGTCAVWTRGSESDAAEMVRKRMKEFIPEGATEGEIVNVIPLQMYEMETSRTLPSHSFPKPGEVVQLD